MYLNNIKMMSESYQLCCCSYIPLVMLYNEDIVTSPEIESSMFQCVVSEPESSVWISWYTDSQPIGADWDAPIDVILGCSFTFAYCLKEVVCDSPSAEQDLDPHSHQSQNRSPSLEQTLSLYSYETE